MSKIYIDFDGVVLDTWEVICENYYKKFKTLEISEKKLRKIMLDLGWDFILSNSKEINHSLRKIKKLSKKYEIYILTKINSMEEQNKKRDFLYKNGINRIIFVPYNFSKTKYANPFNNVLIDDDLKNLKEWEQKDGISIFFNKDLNNYDSYGNINDNFIIINDLLKIYDIM